MQLTLQQISLLEAAVREMESTYMNRAARAERDGLMQSAAFWRGEQDCALQLAALLKTQPVVTVESAG